MWHSPEGNFTEITGKIKHQNVCEKDKFEITTTFRINPERLASKISSISSVKVYDICWQKHT